MHSFESSITDFFQALQDEAQLKLFVSPIVVLVDGESGPYEGHYAFFGSGAIRAEVYSGEIRGVSIWTSPGNLNKPQLYVDLQKVDAFAELDVISKAMRGQGYTLTRDQGGGMFESTLPEGTTENDIGEFMATIGPFAYEKKLSTLFNSYEVWTSINDRKTISKSYFITLAKDWLIRNGKGNYSDLEVKKATGSEKTQVNSAQEDLFDNDIIQNQLYYKAVMMETALKQIAQDDPVINGVYICGGPGDERRITTRDLFQKEGVWDRKVVWKSGTIKGIGSLLETLWVNRSGRILVLEDVDELLAKNRGKARDLLLTILQTQNERRLVSYTRIKRDDDEQK